MPESDARSVGTDIMTVEATPSAKHARKHEAHAAWVSEKRVPSRFKRFCFYLTWRKQRSQLQNERLI